MYSKNNTEKIILFDGVCNLCNGFVQFVIRKDKANIFKFASLQSAYAQQLNQHQTIPVSNLSTVILYDNGKLYYQSTAVLRIARLLGLPWSIATLFVLIPTPLRDKVYDWVARNRYRWFGQRDACMIPTPELKAKFFE